MKGSDFHKQIEAFLTGQMSDVEKTDFEKQIEENPILKKEVEIYQEIDIAFDEGDWSTIPYKPDHKKLKEYEAQLKTSHSIELSQKINEVEHIYFNKEKSTKARFYLRYGWAALLIMSLGVVIYLFLLNSSDTTSDLYASYKHWDNLPSLTKRSEDNDLSKAQKLFLQGDYQNALNIFRVYQSQSKNNYQVLFYIGAIQLELDQNESAIATFTEIANGNSLDSDKARWYLALAFLKTDDIIKAKNELLYLSEDPTRFNHSLAKELLVRIE